MGFLLGFVITVPSTSVCRTTRPSSPATVLSGIGIETAYNATQMHIPFTDYGGCHIFKNDLQSVVNAIEIESRMAHYPIHSSKHNPIEQHFDSSFVQTCISILFDTLERIVELMHNASPPGLRTVNFTMSIDQTGRHAAAAAAQDSIRETITSPDLIPKGYQTVTDQTKTVMDRTVLRNRP